MGHLCTCTVECTQYTVQYTVRTCTVLYAEERNNAAGYTTRTFQDFHVSFKYFGAKTGRNGVGFYLHFPPGFAGFMIINQRIRKSSILYALYMYNCTCTMRFTQKVDYLF